MNQNKIIYKLNNENVKKFPIVSNENTLTFFIISDFTNLSISEITRLLKNNRKIIIDDNAIVDIDKILNIKRSVDVMQFKNLLISKEAYIKMWFHYEYANLLSELEILSVNDADKVVNSDIPLDIGIKIRYLENPEYLLKTLDSSIYLKKIVLEKFDDIEIDLKQEFEEIIKFGHEVKDNLISSSNIYIEDVSKNFNVVCNVLDVNNNFYPEVFDIEKYGIVSCVEFKNNLVAQFSEKDLLYVPSSLKKEEVKVGWIDAVKIKRAIKKQGIRKIILENVSLCDAFPEIKVCTEYGFNKNRTKTYFEQTTCDETIPLFTRFAGWRKLTDELINPNEVPYQLLYFVHELKRILEVKEIVIRLRNLEIAA